MKVARLVSQWRDYVRNTGYENYYNTQKCILVPDKLYVFNMLYMNIEIT